MWLVLSRVAELFEYESLFPMKFYPATSAPSPHDITNDDHVRKLKKPFYCIL